MELKMSVNLTMLCIILACSFLILVNGSGDKCMISMICTDMDGLTRPVWKDVENSSLCMSAGCSDACDSAIKDITEKLAKVEGKYEELKKLVDDLEPVETTTFY